MSLINYTLTPWALTEWRVGRRLLSPPASPIPHFGSGPVIASPAEASPGTLTLAPLILRWVTAASNSNQSDRARRSDNQDVVPLMRPVAASTMPHCATPSRRPCAIALLRDQDSDNLSKSSPTWKGQSHSRDCGSVSQSVNHRNRCLKGQSRWTISLWGLTGPNKDTPTDKGGHRLKQIARLMHRFDILSTPEGAVDGPPSLVQQLHGFSLV